MWREEAVHDNRPAFFPTIEDMFHRRPQVLGHLAREPTPCSDAGLDLGGPGSRPWMLIPVGHARQHRRAPSRIFLVVLVLGNILRLEERWLSDKEQ